MGVVLPFLKPEESPPQDLSGVCTVRIKRARSQAYWIVTVKQPREWCKPLEFPLYYPEHLQLSPIEDLQKLYGMDRVEFILDCPDPPELFRLPPNTKRGETCTE